MTKLFYTMLATLFLINSGYTNNLTELQQQTTNTLINLHTTEELYFNNTQKLCDSLNINKNRHYVFEFLSDAYNNNKYKINSINDLNNINNNYDNIYRTLLHNDNIKIIENINTIFDTKKKIDNLRKELLNLETEKINQKYNSKHTKHNKL